MKLLIAVDSYKGTLSSLEVANIIKENLDAKLYDTDIIAIADGGEGTVDALVLATNSEKINVEVQNAFGKKITSYFGYDKTHNTAFVEIALSSGLGLIDREELNPYNTTSEGLGETMKAALDKGVSKIIVGIGGSSTNDGGAGMLKALGAEFYDDSDNVITFLTAESIGKVARIDLNGLDPRIYNTTIEVACDVTNPLLGENGCSYIYAKQKGATPEMIAQLENYMTSYADVIEVTIGSDHRNVQGAGAAGGLGFGLLTILNAKLIKGLDVVAKATELESRIMNADIVLTGEGALDFQSLNGKAPVEIAKLGKKHNKRVVGVFGVSAIEEHSLFDAIYSIVPDVCTKEESLSNPSKCLAKLIKKVENK